MPIRRDGLLSWARATSILITNLCTLVGAVGAQAQTPTYRQGNFGVPPGTQTTVSVPYTAAQSAGNLNVVIVGWSDATARVSTVADTRGHGYSLAVGPTVLAGARSQAIYYARNISASAAGTNVVTVTFTVAARTPDIRILEYSGIDTSNPVDGTAAGTGTSATSSTPALTTTSATAVLVAGNDIQTLTAGPGAGFTRRLLTAPNGDIAEDRVVTAPGTYNATAPLNGAGAWVMQLVAFRAASAGSGDSQPPTAPANPAAAATSSTQIAVNWSASTDNVGVTGYLLESCQGAGCTTFAPLTTTAGLAFVHTGLTPATTYTYRVRAVDAASNLSVYSNTATATTPAALDTQAPTAPANLTATTTSQVQVAVSWAAATDNVGVTNYLLESCQGAGCTSFVPLTNTAGLTFTHSGLTPATSYSYRVRAADAATNLSVFSNTATATTLSTPDTQAPTAPTALTVTTTSSTQLGLSWTAATDNVSVTGYLLESCQGAGCTTFAPLTTTAGVTFTHSGLAAATSYSYRVRATDAANNLSPFSNTVSATTSGPSSVPTFRQGNFGVPSGTQTTVSVLYQSAQTAGNLNVVIVGWSDATARVNSVVDTRGHSYSLAIGPTVLAGARSQAVYYATNISGSTAGTNTVTVTFTVAARSPDIRILEYSGIDTSNPVDGTAAGTGTSATSSTATLTTTAATALLVAGNDIQTLTAGPGPGFTRRLLTAPNGDIAEDRVVTAAGTYNATAPLNGSGAWVMQLVAFRAAGLGGADTQPPTAPASLAATAASSTKISVGWSAATDNVGVTNYLLESCQGAGCTTFAPLTTTAGLAFTHSGLTPSTTYTYRVRAVDAAGNTGAFSNTVAAITPAPDTEPPTTPVNVAAAVVNGNQIDLSWTSSTDNIGVASYLVERCAGAGCANFTQVAIALSAFYSDPGLTASTLYKYRVRAADANNNLSAYSSIATATTAGAELGVWSGTVTLPIVAIHAALLRDGRVLMWDGQSYGASAIVWDPLTNSSVPVPAPVNIFCSGIEQMSDGQIFVAGGHVTAHAGLSAANIFNPTTQSWTALPRMNFARWYPTVTALPDARLIVNSGESNCDGCVVTTPEIYDPATNAWTLLSTAPFFFPYYPHTFVMPNGHVMVSSTLEAPVVSQVLDLDALTWTAVGGPAVEGGSAAMYLPGKFIKAGRGVNANLPSASSLSTTYVLDTALPSPSWRQVGSMAFPRTYHTLTELPDGSVLATGGGWTTAPTDVSTAVLAAESWSPATESWTTLSSMHAPRLYHSIALLIPDGRVLIAGGGRFNDTTEPTDQFTLEYFSPAYLFRGARPVITAAPAALTYGQDFSIETPDAGRIARVSLVRLGAVTHQINMGQRFLPLNFTAGSGALTITAPTDANLAPPGYYMLFIVDSDGVPSIAAMVHF